MKSEEKLFKKSMFEKETVTPLTNSSSGLWQIRNKMRNMTKTLNERG